MRPTHIQKCFDQASLFFPCVTSELLDLCLHLTLLFDNTFSTKDVQVCRVFVEVLLMYSCFLVIFLLLSSATVYSAILLNNCNVLKRLLLCYCGVCNGCKVTIAGFQDVSFISFLLN